ncbi:MAG: cobalamin-dependent protein [Phycisphaerae bacterium]|nr:cobalamin-dependent protein [Phycisphaerae bacterium]
MRKAAGNYFSLGIGYVAASVKAHGYDVRFIDPNVQETTPDEMAQAIRRDQPVLVGISFMTPQFYAAKEICDVIREVSPSCPIVLGGAHPSVMPQRTLREISAADFVVFGEGEETLVDLLDSLRGNGSELSAINGLAWRNGQEVVVNEARAPIEDLDALPFPDRSLIDQLLYRAQSFLNCSSKRGTIYTSRGCPGRCVFCCSGHRLRSRIRERSIDSVMTEIDELVRVHGIEYLLIKDDTFTMKRERVLAFCEALEARHPRLRWHCMGRVNTVDYDLLARMRKAGLHDIFFGIESGNDEILKKARKGITTEQSRAAVDAASRLGIGTYGAFILGLPGETPETLEQTIRFACSLPLTMAGFSVLIPYPGTQAFEDYYQEEIEGTIDYHSFIASTGIHYVRGYTGLCGLKPEDLVDLVGIAQRRFYFRPRQILRMLHHSTPSMIWGYAKAFFALLAKERVRVHRDRRESA